MIDRTQLPSWKALQVMAANMQSQSIKRLFANDEQRFDNFSISACGILFDYSKNLIDYTEQQQLLKLAEDCELSAWREAMWSGQAINKTEDRAVLHTALRGSGHVAGELAAHVEKELQHIKRFVADVHEGRVTGFSGKQISDVVSIGVGGSNLGPQMVVDALQGIEQASLKVHFISSVDAVPLVNLLKGLNPETTLFIISSKTFTTAETMLNAKTAKTWLLQAAPEEAVAKQFVAVTVNINEALRFGISEQNCFKIWDWVGGRFSLWSAIGLPIALYYGFDVFQQLLSGARAMDEHFYEAPLDQNLPVMLALVGVWNCSFLDMDTHAILPYDQALHALPAYLQQAEMESNGKSVNWLGEKVSYHTCPIVWGQTGINGQHAFYQLLHQGTHKVPCDFIASLEDRAGNDAHHQQLLANCFAQSQALMDGVSELQVEQELQGKGYSQERVEEVKAYKVHPGNRPSNTLLLDCLDAFHLGALIALYEQKIFVQGVIWQIYSFDQWGVELGKVMAKSLESLLPGKQLVYGYDSSTNGLINHYKQKKRQ